MYVEEEEAEQPISSRLLEIRGKNGYKLEYPSARKKRTTSIKKHSTPRSAIKSMVSFISYINTGCNLYSHQ